MVEMPSFRFKQSFEQFTCCLLKGPLKRTFLDIYLTTSFGVRNLGNALAMVVIDFLKCSTFNRNLKNLQVY